MFLQANFNYYLKALGLPYRKKEFYTIISQSTSFLQSFLHFSKAIIS